MGMPELKKGQISGAVVNAEGESVGWIIYSVKALTEAQAAEIIRRVEAYNPWIPVSERLPNQDYQVMVATKNDVFVGCYCSLRGEFVGNLGGVVYNNITHWKPIVLPEQALKDEPK